MIETHPPLGAMVETPLSRAEQFHQNAVECLRAADTSMDPVARTTFELLAHRWQKLAQLVDRLDHDVR
jgi:hypothetical protein